ncbi:MAG: thioesterase [Spirochaetales bacterium]|nr:thioesterase [Spirochaetales bacterium]
MKSDQLIKRYNSSSRNKIRMFIFPFAGGRASAFKKWEEFLAPEIEICPLQLPGREERYYETLYQHVDELMGEMKNAIVDYIDLPYVFFGHSMGAYLCYEACRVIEDMDFPLPMHVFLTGASPKIKKIDDSIKNDIDDETLLSDLKKFDGIPAEVLEDDTLLKMFLKIIRADLSILKSTFKGSDYKFSMPISVFGGDSDYYVNPDELKGWDNFTKAYYSLFILPGGHFFIFKENEKLLSHINRELKYLAFQNK